MKLDRHTFRGVEFFVPPETLEQKKRRWHFYAYEYSGPPLIVSTDMYFELTGNMSQCRKCDAPYFAPHLDCCPMKERQRRMQIAFQNAMKFEIKI